MLDPSIISDVERLFAAPPAFVAPSAIYQDYSTPLSEAVASQLERIIRFYEQYVAGFRGEVRQIREQLSDQAERVADSTDVPSITALIELLEDFAEQRAKTAARRLEDRLRHAVFDPAVKNVLVNSAQRVYALDQQYVEQTADFALFLRSIRSRLDPEARSGRTFDSSSELSKYLTSVLA